MPPKSWSAPSKSRASLQAARPRVDNPLNESCDLRPRLDQRPALRTAAHRSARPRPTQRMGDGGVPRYEIHAQAPPETRGAAARRQAAEVRYRARVETRP